MSNEVAQWLGEIKALRQQLLETQRDLEAALASEAKWRQMYTTEAQQRRTETKLAQQQIEMVKTQVRQFPDSSLLSPDDPSFMEAIQQEVSQLQSHKELKSKLTETMIERDRLREALKVEQANHAQTRKSLTSVIGDTIDKLTKEREKNQNAVNN